MKRQTRQKNKQYTYRVDCNKTTSYRELDGKGSGKKILVSCTTLNHALKNWKLSTITVGNTSSNYLGYLLDTLD